MGALQSLNIIVPGYSFHRRTFGLYNCQHRQISMQQGCVFIYQRWKHYDNPRVSGGAYHLGDGDQSRLDHVSSAPLLPLEAVRYDQSEG